MGWLRSHLLSATKPKIAVRILVDEIAGVKPTVDQSGRRREAFLAEIRRYRRGVIATSADSRISGSESRRYGQRRCARSGASPPDERADECAVLPGEEER